MKKLKVIITSVLCTIALFLTLPTAFAVNTDSDNYRFLAENGYEESYLNKLTDSTINKMAEKIKETTDPDYVNDYEYLLSVGIPEEFLKELSETSLNKIRDYITNSNGNVSAVNCNTQKAASSDALIKKLLLEHTNKSTSAVIGETVCVYWEHEINKPIMRDEDFVEAVWNGDVFCYDADSFYAEDYRRNNPKESWKVSESYCELARASLNSIGHWTQLYTTKKQVGGFMIFKLSPTRPIDAASEYDKSVSIDYSYAAETKDFSTVILCILFILLILTALTIIMKIKKKKKD